MLGGYLLNSFGGVHNALHGFCARASVVLESVLLEHTGVA